MKKPVVDFIFVGPSKTASTWIYDVVREHPSVFVPLAKDIYYFDKYYEKGLSWYESFFTTPAGKNCVRGELSHDYFSNRQAIERIASYNPRVKLICSLRDPYERAYSSFRHMKRLGLTRATFSETLEAAPFIVDEGMYYSNISMILSCFGMASLLVLDFDELKQSPSKVARQIYSFLEVDESFEPSSLNEKVNQARDPRHPLIAKTGKSVALALRQMGCANLVGALKHSEFVNRLVYRAPTANESKVDRIDYPAKLVGCYNTELDKLSSLLGEDYTKWKK